MRIVVDIHEEMGCNLEGESIKFPIHYIPGFTLEKTIFQVNLLYHGIPGNSRNSILVSCPKNSSPCSTDFRSGILAIENGECQDDATLPYRWDHRRAD